MYMAKVATTIVHINPEASQHSIISRIRAYYSLTDRIFLGWLGWCSMLILWPHFIAPPQQYVLKNRICVYVHMCCLTPRVYRFNTHIQHNTTLSFTKYISSTHIYIYIFKKTLNSYNSIDQRTHKMPLLSLLYTPLVVLLLLYSQYIYIYIQCKILAIPQTISTHKNIARIFLNESYAVEISVVRRANV